MQKVVPDSSEETSRIFLAARAREVAEMNDLFG